MIAPNGLVITIEYANTNFGGMHAIEYLNLMILITISLVNWEIAVKSSNEVQSIMEALNSQSSLNGSESFLALFIIYFTLAMLLGVLGMGMGVHWMFSVFALQNIWNAVIAIGFAIYLIGSVLLYYIIPLGNPRMGI